ncbi:hypothetical protein EUTSA_v10027996mg [Eutrema salsugineum]|uniref:Uncharacterized protein n=1 Tax=Eutrema salsugineum TaxID=72664 RepID=V4LW49_EUTSA|nr:hypothetical protein EUTSA_v10027996mg [Eutrema salsugineum]
MSKRVNGVLVALIMICFFISIGMFNVVHGKTSPGGKTPAYRGSPSRKDPYCSKYPAAKDPVGICTKPNADALCKAACGNKPNGKCLIHKPQSPKKQCYCWYFDSDGSVDCW